MMHNQWHNRTVISCSVGGRTVLLYFSIIPIQFSNIVHTVYSTSCNPGSPWGIHQGVPKFT